MSKLPHTVEAVGAIASKMRTFERFRKLEADGTEKDTPNAVTVESIKDFFNWLLDHGHAGLNAWVSRIVGQVKKQAMIENAGPFTVTQLDMLQAQFSRVVLGELPTLCSVGSPSNAYRRGARNKR